LASELLSLIVSCLLVVSLNLLSISLASGLDATLNWLSVSLTPGLDLIGAGLNILLVGTRSLLTQLLRHLRSSLLLEELRQTLRFFWPALLTLGNWLLILGKHLLVLLDLRLLGKCLLILDRHLLILSSYLSTLSLGKYLLILGSCLLILDSALRRNLLDLPAGLLSLTRALLWSNKIDCVCLLILVDLVSVLRLLLIVRSRRLNGEFWNIFFVFSKKKTFFSHFFALLKN
jgi:hypothetical protein